MSSDMNQDIWDIYYSMLIIKPKICKHWGKKGLYYKLDSRNIFTKRDWLWHSFWLLVDYGIYK